MNIGKTLFAQLMDPLEDFSSHCRSLRRRSLRKVYDMRRSIPRDGLRATDIPRESARHRGLSFGAVCQALPHGLAAGDRALDAGRCQRGARLAYPRRIRPAEKTIPNICATFATRMPRPAKSWCSLPTTSCCRQLPSARSTGHAGRWSCASSGSSSICASKSFTATQIML